MPIWPAPLAMTSHIDQAFFRRTSLTKRVDNVRQTYARNLVAASRWKPPMPSSDWPSRFLGRGFLGLDLLKLSICQVRVEPLGMICFKNTDERGLVTDLQRELKVAPWIGLRIGLGLAEAAGSGSGTG